MSRGKSLTDNVLYVVDAALDVSLFCLYLAASWVLYEMDRIKRGLRG